MPSAVVSEPAKQDVSEAFIGERRAANPALGLPIPIATRFVWVGTMSSYSAGELAAFDERMPTIHAAVVGHTSGLFPHTTLVLRRNLVIEMSSDITFEWFLRLLVQLEVAPRFRYAPLCGVHFHVLQWVPSQGARLVGHVARTMANHNQGVEELVEGRLPQMMTLHLIWTSSVQAQRQAVDERVISLYPRLSLAKALLLFSERALAVVVPSQ